MKFENWIFTIISIFLLDKMKTNGNYSYNILFIILINKYHNYALDTKLVAIIGKIKHSSLNT